MTRFTEYMPGTPCWVDVSSSEIEATTAFYRDLLGWEPAPDPRPEAGGYGMFRLGGTDVAGFGPAQEGMPAAWTTYIASDDVAATAERITAAGGAVLAGPLDVFDAGRMVFAADPHGAPFGVWQAGQHHGAGLANEPGSFCWNELVTDDPAATHAFYGTVFGWAAVEMGEGYWGQDAGAGPVAGVMARPAGMAGIPLRWNTYLAVASLEETLARTGELGGTVVHGPMDSAFGAFAGIVDPGGAMFTAIQLVG